MPRLEYVTFDLENHGHFTPPCTLNKESRVLRKNVDPEINLHIFCKPHF